MARRMERHGMLRKCVTAAIAIRPRRMQTTDGGTNVQAESWTLLELTSSLYGILTCQRHAPNATSDCTVILYVAVVGAAYIITMDRDYDSASPIRNLWPCDEARELFNRLPEPLVALRRGKGATQ